MEENNNDMQKKKFEAIKYFFEQDLKIKEKLIKLTPTSEDLYNEDSKIKYLDRAKKEILCFKESLTSFFKELRWEYKVELLNDFFNNIYSQFLLKGTDIMEIYTQLFSNMRMSFLEEVKEQSVGYSFRLDIDALIKKASTINELLHGIHSYIINCNWLLQSMPKINTKVNKFKYQITLYGEDTTVAKKFFDDFPLDLDVGITDIVSMQNKIIMMIRNRGHALSIEIDLSDSKKYFVKYFVPKFCNKQMIENLKGVNKGQITNNGATGQFEVESDQIGQEIYGFIEKVPMDSDIPEVQAFYR